MTKSLDEIYNNGTCHVPPPGRYAVEMEFYGMTYRILEKKISQGSGTNHLPIFLLRYRKIKLMDFSIHVAQGEVVFKYTKLPLEDHLKKIGYHRWLGKIYWQGQFSGYFLLVKI